MLISQISIKGFLSFGATGIDEMPLRDLNVLIGPNGSGKSNFISALMLLAQLPRGLPLPSAEMDGTRGWIHQTGEEETSAQISTTLSLEEVQFPPTHSIELKSNGANWIVLRESIGIEVGPPEYGWDYRYELLGGPALLQLHPGAEIEKLDVNPYESILSQFRMPGIEYTHLGNVLAAYQGIYPFVSWQFGPGSEVRRASGADQRNDRLTQTSGNLGLVLSKLKLAARTTLKEALNEFYPGLEDIDVVVSGGTCELHAIERGGRSIPASRLSDGTLRFLALLSLLLQPTPPPLLLIEEPELGMHPDILPYLGKLIKQASQRSQLVVSTHSQILLDAFSETPEDVVVFQKVEGETTATRLSHESLSEWLKEHTLGELWNMGQIGGNRW